MTASNLTAFEKSFVAKLAVLNAPIEYRTDSKGRTVRVPNAERPVSREEVIATLSHMRMIEEEEMLEALGKGVTDYMLKAGQLKRDTMSASRFWVTKACAASYGLPEYLGPRTFIF